MIVKSEIVAGLRALGVTRDDKVLVHTALRAIGHVVGGARTVVEALLEAAGTVMMPAYSGDLSEPADWRHPPAPAEQLAAIRHEIPPYDPARTPTRGMGAVAEYFRTYPGTLRSNHPQSSFCANGAAALKLVGTHRLDFRFGRDSPLGTLRTMNGKVLMLGAPRNTCSFLYLGQSGPHVKKRSPVVSGGATKWIEYTDIEHSDIDFAEIIQAMIDERSAAIGTIGNATATLFRAADPVILRFRRDAFRP